jgi:hypothetical protein
VFTAKPLESILVSLLCLIAPSMLACSAPASESAGSAQAALGAPTDPGGTDDGTPTRTTCTSKFGNGLSGGFGRLDGFLVSIVPPGSGQCSADRHHVHLQVLSGGEVYDVAVNADGGFMATRDAPLPGDAWAEGWHTPAHLDYVSDLGLHSQDFQQGDLPTLAEDIETALANANHISVFATTYSSGGAHLVHRGSGANSNANRDGLIVTDPLSPTAHVYAFHFSNQTF